MTANTGTSSSSQPSIKYRKLRSPKSNGETLQIPSLSKANEVWDSNLRAIEESNSISVGNISLAELRRQGRSELTQLATDYTRRYRDISPVSSDQVILSGHQPKLFHPGVWYKNFALSKLGKQFNCHAINLVVDNDICGNASIGCPKIAPRKKDEAFDWENVSLTTIPIDQPGPNVPFEFRMIQDVEYFRDFENRASQAIAPIQNQPLVRLLWSNVLKAGRSLTEAGGKLNLGGTIAASRHKLEAEAGLETLEVPLSSVAKTIAFAEFVLAILSDMKGFRNIYNKTLKEYRNVHKIRSRSHPVPELDLIDDWTELPFWIYQYDDPTRRRLFARPIGSGFMLSDQNGWQSEFLAANFAEQFSGIMQESSIAIRPKALTTTMYSRMVLSDLFIHGIGGAKYDQLTDVIAEKFFGTRLPSYYTLSATLNLPFIEPLATKIQLVGLQQKIRELQFNPERFIDQPGPEQIKLIQKKLELVAQHLTPNRTQENHNSIVAANRELASFSNVELSDLVEETDLLRNRLRASEIMGSREYSFCLFGEGLLEQLLSIA